VVANVWIVGINETLNRWFEINDKRTYYTKHNCADQPHQPYLITFGYGGW